MTDKSMSTGQRAYETRRAAKAGMPLDKWLHEKEKSATQAAAPAVPKKKGAFSRWLDRAHAPLKPAKKD